MIRQLSIMILVAGVILPAHGQIIQLVKEINTAPGASSSPHDFVVAGGKIFFIGTDNMPQVGLFSSGGNPGNTQKVGPTSGVSGSLRYLSSFNNKVYFSYDDGTNGSELWVTDDVPGNATMVKDIYPGGNSTDPRFFTVAGNKLYFRGDAPGSNSALFVTDGTSAGTILLKQYADILNGMDSFAVLNNELYFRSDDGSGFGFGWRKTESQIHRKEDRCESGCNASTAGNEGRQTDSENGRRQVLTEF